MGMMRSTSNAVCSGFESVENSVALLNKQIGHADNLLTISNKTSIMEAEIEHEEQKYKLEQSLKAFKKRVKAESK